MSRGLHSQLCHYACGMSSRSLRGPRYEKYAFWVILTFVVVIVALFYVCGG